MCRGGKDSIHPPLPYRQLSLDLFLSPKFASMPSLCVYPREVWYLPIYLPKTAKKQILSPIFGLNRAVFSRSGSEYCSFFSFFAIFTIFFFPAAVPTYLPYYYYCPQHSNRARTNLNKHTFDTGRQPPPINRSIYYINDSWGEQQRSSLYNTDSSTHLRPLGTILLPTIRRGARRREFK
jgi:hypothetical protein